MLGHFAEILNHQGDHAADNTALEAPEVNLFPVLLLDVFGATPELEFAHVLDGNETGAEGIVDIVIGVGNLVCHVDHLAL